MDSRTASSNSAGLWCDSHFCEQDAGGEKPCTADVNPSAYGAARFTIACVLSVKVTRNETTPEAL